MKFNVRLVAMSTYRVTEMFDLYLTNMTSVMVEKLQPLHYSYIVDELIRVRTLFEQSLPIFSALGDTNRQQLLLLMFEGEPKSVGELAAQTHLSRPSISHHLKVLKDAHIVVETKVGTRRYYRPQIGEYIEPLQDLIESVIKLQKSKEGK